MEKKAGKYTPGEVKESDIILMPGMFGGEDKYILVDGLYASVDRIKSGRTPDPRINYPKIRDMKCRDDDLFICAFPKSGTHWVWEICSMLVSGKDEYLTQLKVENMMEFHYPEEFDDIPSPRILNTHIPFRFMPETVRAGTGKILFVQRNPKDVTVSGFHHLLNMSDKNPVPSPENFNHFFQAFCTRGLNTNWFDYTNEWNKTLKTRTDLSIHMVYYEDLKKDLVKGITEIANFLGTDNDPSFIEKVAELCEFKNMKKVNHGVKNIEDYKDKDKFIKNVYRKGEVGDWKNWFTVSQNEQFDALYAEKMKDCDFTFRFTQQ